MSMCCILCEEPVRSVLFGLAAVGVVAIVRTVQKTLKGSDSTMREEGAGPVEAQPADSES
jgi:hypothetical protein